MPPGLLSLDLTLVRAGIRAAALPPGLRALCRLDLAPAEFLPQRLLRGVAGLAADPRRPESLHLAHRRQGARSQTRAALAPGDLLLRGCVARAHWTLAVPPLLSPHGGGTRGLVVFTDDQLPVEDGRVLEQLLRGLVQSHRLGSK
jgi:hypothetical protein